MTQANATRQKNSKPTLLGFGFDPSQTEHCFLVTLPASRAKTAEVIISEHFQWRPVPKGEVTDILENDHAQLKAVLSRMVWDQIEESLKRSLTAGCVTWGKKAGAG